MMTILKKKSKEGWQKSIAPPQNAIQRNRYISKSTDYETVNNFELIRILSKTKFLTLEKKFSKQSPRLEFCLIITPKLISWAGVN